DRRSVPRLVDEPFAELGVRPEMLPDDLQCHFATEPHIRGSVHHAHATLAEHTIDTIVAQFGADQFPRRVASHTRSIIGSATPSLRWADTNVQQSTGGRPRDSTRRGTATT